MKYFYTVKGTFTYEKSTRTFYADVHANNKQEACRIAIKQIRSVHADLPFVEKYEVVS